MQQSVLLEHFEKYTNIIMNLEFREICPLLLLLVTLPRLALIVSWDTYKGYTERPYVHNFLLELRISDASSCPCWNFRVLWESTLAYEVPRRTTHNLS